MRTKHLISLVFFLVCLIGGIADAGETVRIGSIDYGSTGETPPIFAQAAGASLVYVACMPAAPTAEAILVP